MRVSKTLLVLFGALLSGTLTSCTSSLKHSNDRTFEKEYDVENFNMIKLEGAYNVEISQGNTESFTMETSEELHEKVRVWVSDDMLHVKTNVKNISSDEIKLLITIKDLSYLKVEGGAFITTNGFLKFEDLDVQIEGGAHIKMQLTANKLKARAEGAVNMEFEGAAEELIAISEGAGNIDADELKAKRVECRVSGVGNASVFATEELDARVEGLGKIGYRGNPTLYKKVDGIGLVYKK